MEACGGCCGSVRLVGDYILGPKIGAGSFAVVWLARHRLLGVEVAVKEIDKKQLSSKLKEKESLFKEIDILRNISHPNIIRLHEAIQTEEKIYLVLEYCTGGDLAAYINRHGRVSEAVARHFMRQLASGLQVLRDNNLIHRDLKPQNLLLSSNNATSVLKIGDFGFARYLMPQGLADTLCGSPLYMAPEIIQNQKYDAKADLWSVGAILFQLVTGKPPFDGSSQFQLFQNILTSSELQFPQDILGELHHDCVDLCKGLLRHNPVERLTFEEFFGHKFLAVERTSGSAYEFQHNAGDDRLKMPVCAGPSSSSDARGSNMVSGLSKGDSLESVEWEYVLVNPNLASMETISSSLESSLVDSSTARPICILKKISKGISGQAHTGGHSLGSIYGLDSAESRVYASKTSLSVELNAQGSSSLHPSRRIQLLYQYVHALSDVAMEKLNAGLHLESFSVELVALAVWKEALRVCSDWLSLSPEAAFHSSSTKDQKSTGKHKSTSLSGDIDFSRPGIVYSWVEQGFIATFDRAEKISDHLQDIDGNAEMPDAMEIIFQTALSAGKHGAVEELMGNGRNAVAAYSKATILLSFILMEATSLPFHLPFSLSLSDQQRIYKYITSLEAHLNQSQVLFPSTKTKETDHSPTK